VAMPAWSMPGIQTTEQPSILRLHSNMTPSIIKNKLWMLHEWM
jgi:hypothetical protein